MRQYRLIVDHPTSGPYNMAIDEAIMNSVGTGDSPPTLRLYEWKPACLSLGYGQSWQDVDFDAIVAHDWDIVRRPTGGRAIFHTDELTYSLSLPPGHPLAAGTIVDSYRRISQALLAGINRLGAQTQADKRANTDQAIGPVCFETPSHYEITTQDGRKLIGSAQLRRRQFMLQHGTLPLYGDLAQICDALAFEGEIQRELAKANVRRRAVTLAEALGGMTVTWEMAAEAIVQGFEQTFDIKFFKNTLTPVEISETERLAQEVYNTEAHILRR